MYVRPASRFRANFAYVCLLVVAVNAVAQETASASGRDSGKGPPGGFALTLTRGSRFTTDFAGHAVWLAPRGSIRYSLCTRPLG